MFNNIAVKFTILLWPASCSLIHCASQVIYRHCNLKCWHFAVVSCPLYRCQKLKSSWGGFGELPLSVPHLPRVCHRIPGSTKYQVTSGALGTLRHTAPVAYPAVSIAFSDAFPAFWTPQPAIGWVRLLVCLVGTVEFANVKIIVLRVTFVQSAVAQPQVNIVIHARFYAEQKAETSGAWVQFGCFLGKRSLNWSSFHYVSYHRRNRRERPQLQRPRAPGTRRAGSEPEKREIYPTLGIRMFSLLPEASPLRLCCLFSSFSCFYTYLIHLSSLLTLILPPCHIMWHKLAKWPQICCNFEVCLLKNTSVWLASWLWDIQVLPDGLAGVSLFSLLKIGLKNPSSLE